MHNGFNLAGVLSCALMMAFVTLAMWASPRIATWAEALAPKHKEVWKQDIERRLKLMPSNAIDSRNYVAPFHAVHIIDFDRSDIFVQPEGSVVARCAIQGCGVTVLMGRNVAQAVVVDERTR